MPRSRLSLLALVLLLAHASAGVSPSSLRPSALLDRARRSALGVGRSLKAGVDTNADGEVSVDEMEGAARRWRQRGVRLAERARRLFARQRHACLCLASSLGLAYGHHLAHLILFTQTFASSGWPLARAAGTRARQAYDAAKARLPRDTSTVAPLRRELESLAAELAALRREDKQPRRQEALIDEMRSVRERMDKQLAASPPSARAVTLLLAAADPRVVRDVALGLWSAVSVAVAAASSAAARSVGIGMTVGEAVGLLATQLIERSDRLVRRAMSNLPSEAAALSYFGPSVLASAVSSAAGIASRSACCWLAFRLQESWQDESLEEASLAVQARSTATWLLAMASFQAQRSGAYHLPRGTRALLFPAFGFEMLLRHVGDRLATKDIK
ncbi:hypothetical protein AB1Y20_011526 [Prymnesium parvum]|uniref:EF-hand domain-containing protein n=1 Tax=Prymnesium parvum TaxID=97485 RepID=A0AB34IK96_PRYPA